MDLTYIGIALVNRVARQVNEDYTHSDHQTICMDINGELGKMLMENYGWCSWVDRESF